MKSSKTDPIGTRKVVFTINTQFLFTLLINRSSRPTTNIHR
ncbi:hypothetical protein Ccrd_022045 [Cynara cardunculus var. scolymus]|uniref:Uncharacterized protein n=1 Tax=Cynara cardunculus var. scolymus TaxID=59895 RepID=A0A118K015_CYNCS|nr:hypothetical protein Ccrd_022045 [Cynara cardunculus var. scolymus]